MTADGEMDLVTGYGDEAGFTAEANADMAHQEIEPNGDTAAGDAVSHAATVLENIPNDGASDAEPSSSMDDGASVAASFEDSGERSYEPDDDEDASDGKAEDIVESDQEEKNMKTFIRRSMVLSYRYRAVRAVSHLSTLMTSTL
ncbi:hypothetical protein PC112_g11407 [Phytophthora cactorum]|nr:hypothetical protein PC112_g11407 [Phytophthora cactorum]